MADDDDTPLPDDPLGEGGGDAEEEASEQQEGDDAQQSEPMLLIVVGAHLRAEVGDRPLAYRMRERIVEWIETNWPPASAAPRSESEDDDGAESVHDGRPEVIVLTDVWYMNDAHLRSNPVISIGGPGVNALTAYLGDKLASVLVIDDVLMIQMDAALEELTAAVWGVNHDATVAAVDAFIERYLAPFMEAVAKSMQQ